MPFTGIANPEQLIVLSEVVDEFCRSRAIVDASEREYVGQLVLLLYQRGTASLDDLLAGLHVAYEANLRQA